MYFYGDNTSSIYDMFPWSYHGGRWDNGVLTGELSFSRWIGDVNLDNRSRLFYRL